MAETTTTTEAGKETEVKPPVKRLSDDRYMKQMLADMHMAVNPDGSIEKLDPSKATADNPPVENHLFTTLGEHARYKKEREEAKKEEKPPEDKKEEKAGAGTEKKEEKPPGEAKTEEKKEEKPPEEKKKIQVEHVKPIEEIVEGVTRRILQERKTEEPPKKKEETQPDPDAEFIEGRSRVEKRQIELAKFAAQKYPDKFGAAPKKWVAYLKKVDDYIAKQEPDWDSSADENFAALIEENKPTYEGVDEEDLREEMIEARVEARVESKFKPKLETVEKARRNDEIKPQIDTATEEYRKNAVGRMAIDEKSPLAPVIKTITEKGHTPEAWSEAKALNPLAAKVVKKFTDGCSELGREAIELVAEVATPVQFDPQRPADDPQNQRAVRQSRLFRFVDNQEAIFNKNGAQMKVREGKNFLPRAQFYGLPEAERAKFWTIGIDDILDMLAIDASIQATNAYNAAVKEREEEGYVLGGKKEEPKTEKKEEEVKPKTEGSPKASAAPGPGAGSGAEQKETKGFGITMDDLKKQWSGGAATWA